MRQVPDGASPADGGPPPARRACCCAVDRRLVEQPRRPLPRTAGVDSGEMTCRGSAARCYHRSGSASSCSRRIWAQVVACSWRLGGGQDSAAGAPGGACAARTGARGGMCRKRPRRSGCRLDAPGGFRLGPMIPPTPSLGKVHLGRQCSYVDLHHG